MVMAVAMASSSRGRGQISLSEATMLMTFTMVRVTPLIGSMARKRAMAALEEQVKGQPCPNPAGGSITGQHLLWQIISHRSAGDLHPTAPHQFMKHLIDLTGRKLLAAACLQGAAQRLLLARS